MKIILVLLLIINLQIFINAFHEFKIYNGYKVINITPRNSSQLKFIDQLYDIPNIDVWNSVRKVDVPTIVMIPPDVELQFKQMLRANNLDYRIVIDNLKRIFDVERFENIISYVKESDGISFRRYNRFDKINDYLLRLTKEHPQITSLIHIGKSYEGRPLNILKVSTGGNGSKPAIFVDGGIHAREWIAPAQVLYIINQLVENQDETKDMIDQVDWYLLPVVNPDGYEFSHTADRLWRKTRSINKDSICIGVDPNRNFDFHWHEMGASSDPCSIRYAGPKSFSEIEIQALTNFASKIKEQIKLYLAFHSYGPVILYPWGHTSELPENGDELHTLGLKVRKAFIKYKDDYEVGNLHDILYPATGGSFDWFKAVLGVPLTYTLELPKGGVTGFDVSPRNILPIVSDTFRGIRIFADYVKYKFVNN